MCVGGCLCWMGIHILLSWAELQSLCACVSASESKINMVHGGCRQRSRGLWVSASQIVDQKRGSGSQLYKKCIWDTDRDTDKPDSDRLFFSLWVFPLRINSFFISHSFTRPRRDGGGNGGGGDLSQWKKSLKKKKDKRFPFCPVVTIFWPFDSLNKRH